MLIRNANLLNPGTERGIYDILIRDGKIAQIAPHIDAEEEVELDVQEMYVTPGLVDAHTHLGLKADSQGELFRPQREKEHPVPGNAGHRCHRSPERNLPGSA